MMANILLVDDESNIRMTVKMALEHAGHTLVTASDGVEGLERFGDGSAFDVVLLDQRMPGMEGLQVLREMRRRRPDTRIIMATAFGTIDLAVEAMKAGATDFLRKPFTTETLRGAVHSALQEDTPAAANDVIFGATTINGFRIEFQASSGTHDAAGFRQVFTVVPPSGDAVRCMVILPAYITELVKAHSDREQMPGGDRFWQALCEEALANYLWQHAEAPPPGELRIDDLTSGLRRFVDAVIAA